MPRRETTIVLVQSTDDGVQQKRLDASDLQDPDTPDESTDQVVDIMQREGRP